MGKRVFGNEADELLQLLSEIAAGKREATKKEKAYFRQITDLILFGARIENLRGIEQLTNLQTLDLSRTKVSNLRGIERLTNLQTLDLSETEITDLMGIEQLTNLQTLDLSKTEITDPRGIEQLTNLQFLHLNGTGITDLRGIEQLTNLLVLYLSGTGITDLSDIKQLANLHVLDLSGTGIANLRGIEKLTNLQLLNLSRTKVSNLRGIEQLTNLQLLHLSGTRIKNLSGIEQLKNLQSLDLSYTDITDLSGIEQLVNLQSMNLSGTKTTNLNGIEQLTDLQSLDLSWTKLTNIPKEVAFLPEIFKLSKPFYLSLMDWRENDFKGIYLAHCQLTTQPISLFEQPKELIKAYYDAEKVQINEAKVIFLGHGRAGKTRTIRRILNHGADINYETEMTPGVQIEEYRPEDSTFTIKFWDFGGQDNMHSMHRCFLTSRTCYVVVLNNSFTESLMSQAKYWLRNIKGFADGSPVIIAVNCVGDIKSDGIDTQELRKIYPNLVEQVIYSAKDSEKMGITEFKLLMNAITTQAQKLDSCGMEFPESWANIRTELLKQAEAKKPYIDKEDYLKLCEKYGVNDPKIRTWLLEWFNDLGICFSYHTDSETGGELEQYKVLNPKWLTNAIYIIINSGMESAIKGVILKSEIIELLKSNKGGVEKDETYEESDVDYILAVMRKFHFSYQVPPDDEPEREFVPALCKELRPDNVEPNKPGYKKRVQLEMRYEYLPDNVIHQLMIDFYDEPGIRWRHGMRVDIKTHKQSAVVWVDENVLHIDTYSDGSQPTWIMIEELRTKISDINKRLNITAMDYIIIQKDGYNEFNVNAVLDAKKQGVDKFPATNNGYYRLFPISEILDEAYGGENVDNYIEEAKKSNDRVTAEGLMSSPGIVNNLNGCTINIDMMGIKCQELISTLIEHQNEFTAAMLDTFTETLAEQNKTLLSLANEVKGKRTKKDKLDVMHKATSIGVNSINIATTLWNAAVAAAPILIKLLPSLATVL